MLTLYCLRPKGFNIGNEAIFIAMKHFLRESFDESFNIISLPATSRYESHSKAGISSSTMFEVNQYGHGLIIGGGNLYENGELEVNKIALKALEAPMMIFSVSRGRIYNRKGDLVDRTDVMSDDNMRLLNERADISMSREHATQAYIANDLGVDNIMGGCPTLFMNEIPQHMIPVKDELKTDVLISIRTPDLMSIPLEDKLSVRKDIESFIAHCKVSGYENIKFLCHDHRDIPFAASFDGIDYLYTDDIYEYLSWLKNTRLNITYRLHSFIPCVSFGVPSIKISYDERALSLVKTIGMDEWNINHIKDDVQESVASRIDGMDKYYSMIEKNKSTLWPELRDVITENFKAFGKLIKESRS